jgi:hypothetical protein
MRKVLILVILFTVGIPVYVYFRHFGKNGTSGLTSDWSNFSNYFYSFVSFCNLILFAILTFYIHQYNLSNDKALEKRTIMLDRPIISFYLNRHDGVFYIHNVGKGSAINVIIKSDLTNSAEWQYAYIWYSVVMDQKGEKMAWTGNSMQICATYSDSMGNNYVSYMDDNVLRVIDCSDEKSKKKFKNELEKAALPSIEKPTWRTPF